MSLVSNAILSGDHGDLYDNAAHFVGTKRVVGFTDGSVIDVLKPFRLVVRQLGRVSRLR